MSALSAVGQMFGFSGKNTERKQEAQVASTLLAAVAITSLMHYINWPVLPSARALMTSNMLGGMAGVGLALVKSEKDNKNESQVTDIQQIKGFLLLSATAVGVALLGINMVADRYKAVSILVLTQGALSTLFVAGLTWQVCRWSNAKVVGEVELMSPKTLSPQSQLRQSTDYSFQSDS